MASDDKKTKTDPAPKIDSAPKSEPPAKDKSASDTSLPKAEGGESSAPSPSNYSRGEGQKRVTQAYKDNWNVIFGKKTPTTGAKKTTMKSEKKKPTNAATKKKR